jgi:hypothetical protein
VNEEWVTTKAVLLDHIERDWRLLHDWLDSLTDAQWTTIRNADGWAIKDHVAHMTAWERSALSLLQKRPQHEGLGITKELDDTRNIDAINHAIFTRHKDEGLAKVREAFGAGHDAMLAHLDTLSDDDLMRPCDAYVADSGDFPVMNIVYGNTAHHFREHLGWMQEQVVALVDLRSSCKAFANRERDDWHYNTMNDILEPVIDAMSASPSVDDLYELRLRWMFVVAAWNRQAYRKSDPLDHFLRIAQPFATHWKTLLLYRQRSITSLTEQDLVTIKRLFLAFRHDESGKLFGATGIAKGFHLLAPRFFMAWDTSIFTSYGYGRQPNADDYCDFMQRCAEQIQAWGDSWQVYTDDINPLKALDRYHYWHYTKRRYA